MNVDDQAAASAYLDHAATTTVRPAAQAALIEALAVTGNAASLHTPGRSQRKLLEESREQLAGLAGVAPNRVIFTSGGTEANNLAIKGYYRQVIRHSPQRRRIVVGASEHPSAIAAVRRLGGEKGAQVAVLPVDSAGQVRLDELRRLLDEHDRVAMVVIMAANNETGTIAPFAQVAEICREAGVPWHCDAVQAAPWLDLRVLSGCTMAISGHKFGGPVGVGALLGCDPEQLQPLLDGGGQESRARPGTTPVALIASLVAAARDTAADRATRWRLVAELRDQLVAGVRATIPRVHLHTPVATDAALPGHALISFDGADADSLLLLLDAAGVAASAGSACSAGLVQASPVLTAMGVDTARAKAAIRFSLGWNTTPAEVALTLRVLPDAVAKARAVGAAPTPAALR